MGETILFVCLFLQTMRASGQTCVNESPIPPIVPPTTWTAWYSVDDPTDGTDNETLSSIRAIYPTVCASPTLAECRVRFLQTDTVDKGQTLSTSCTPTAGLLCKNSDQPNQEVCLDYEIRFECPSPSDALPEAHFYWDLSTKTSVDDDEPMTCDTLVTSVYPNIGGMTGTVAWGTLQAADSFDSSDHLCAIKSSEPDNRGGIRYGTATGRCITDTACCTSGWSVAFWMRYQSIPSTLTRFVFSSGGHTSAGRGLSISLTRKFSLIVRGESTGNAWIMKMADASTFPPDAWTHHCFTYTVAQGTKYYKNGDLLHSLVIPTSESPSTSDLDEVTMLSENNDAGSAYKPAGVFSDFKMFYRTFNASEVQKLYLKETSESNLLIYYLRKHNHNNSFDVEIECLAKAGSSPNITWYRSNDGDHFSVVSPSSEAAIYETSPNRYRRRSVLVVRGLSFSTDVIFVCEALDIRTGGAVSKFATIPKRSMYWTPWLSADDPTDGNDMETLNAQQQVFDLLCNNPSDIQCRTLYDDVPSHQTGQILNTNCTVSSGLECLGTSQSNEDGQSCYDYTVRYSCPEYKFQWTNWYDTNDPTGTMEEETFITHTAQSYTDLCSYPIGAECRIKGTNEDIFASGIIPEIPYLCNANGFRCQDANNTKPCPDVEVRYRCPTTSVTNLRVDSLRQISHHLDANLRLQCDVTEGSPVSPSFVTEWLWLDRSQSQAAVLISPGNGVTITAVTLQTSVLKIDDFASSMFANRTLVCIARDGIVKDANTIATFNLASACDAPIGISSGQIQLSQISPSSVKFKPFKIPAVNGLDAWVPAVSDATQMLDFDLGVAYDITGIAIQGDPTTDSPTSMVTELDLYSKDIGSTIWKQPPLHIVTAALSGGRASFNTLDPNITTRFLRLNPTLWQGSEIMMKVEIYGCAVGESTLTINGLTKKYDVITNNFTFTCQAEHYPLPTVRWLADNVSISAVEGVFQISEQDGVFPTKVSVLSLIGFQPANDSVEFSCQATAGVDTVVERIYTQYSFDGPVSVTSNTPVHLGGDLRMTCAASGDDIYVIGWSKRPNGSNETFNPISPGGRFDIVNMENSATNWESTLTIIQFGEADEGEYACHVNSDTARAVTVVNGKTGVGIGQQSAIYDENTNTYRLECEVFFLNLVPDVTWLTPSGESVNMTTGRYEIQHSAANVGNLTKQYLLLVHQYKHEVDDGNYVCTANVAATGESISATLATLYAYQGTVRASVTKPIITGQPVRLTCEASDDTTVHHADWLRVVGDTEVALTDDASHTIHEARTGGLFHLYLDITSYSEVHDGYYACSINNGTATAGVAVHMKLDHFRPLNSMRGIFGVFRLHWSAPSAGDSEIHRVDSLIQCGNMCINDPQCVSFNFADDGSIFKGCELINGYFPFQHLKYTPTAHYFVVV